MFRKSIYFVLFFAFSLFSCQKQHHAVTNGIYYWKTNFQLSPYEAGRLKQLQCKRIYLRLFDADWDEQGKQLIPRAVVRFHNNADTSYSYIPVLFITQKAIKNIVSLPADTAAARLVRLTDDICGYVGINPDEIQVDCDWSYGTKDVYFELLKAIKHQPYCQHKTLSCTIRMHQVKYILKNGVPPVDRGMLMCYNMGNMKKYGDENSILDVGLVHDYLKELNNYPLALDVALPLFQWSILFRNRQFRGILRVQPDPANGPFANLGHSMYQCTSDTLWHGYYLKNGDRIRIEAPLVKDILAAADYTSKKLQNGNIKVVFFHCDSIILSKYNNHELETIYNAFR